MAKRKPRAKLAQGALFSACDVCGHEFTPKGEYRHLCRYCLRSFKMSNCATQRDTILWAVGRVFQLMLQRRISLPKKIQGSAAHIGLLEKLKKAVAIDKFQKAIREDWEDDT